MNDVCVYLGEQLAAYGFGDEHPFGPQRHDAFASLFRRRGLDQRVSLCQPVVAGRDAIELFHTPDYVDRVVALSATGEGYLDAGDTPAFPGVFQAAATVAGTVLKGLDDILAGRCRRAFIPIAGLHHARRDAAAGFCVFNDCGIAIEALRRRHGIQRVAYVDIDAHHGDGVFYAFESDPDLIFADLHEDGRFLYPGTGFADETGKGDAAGSKLNIPMPMQAGDEDFLQQWPRVEAHLRRLQPEFILFQCGADSVAGDPITHMQYTPRAHAHAARSLCRLADQFCEGRLLAMGGGGYNLHSLAEAWCRVVEGLIDG
jgi:acetoin utilization protein AcuC